MNIEECFYLGYTSKLHGKKGDITAKLDVDSPEKYKKLESVLIRVHKQDNVLIPFFIESSQILNDNTLKFKLEDINSAEQAKEFIGKELYLPLNLLPKLSGNQFYFHEVIGFSVKDQGIGIIGTIKEVLDYPTQSILAINHDSGKEILVPITDKTIITLDRENQLMEIKTPEGLIDLYLS